MDPWYVPQELYDMLMALPDGADITQYFEFDDPQWNIMKVTLLKTEDDAGLSVCNSVLAMEPTPPDKES